MTAYALFDTAIGTCGLAWGPNGLLHVQLPEATVEATRQRLTRHLDEATETAPPPEIQETIDAIQALTAGEDVDLRVVAVDLTGVSPYDRRVYAAIRNIGPGQTRTYGDIATDLGEPGAARAVGRAMGHNPCPIVIPCHRVVAANGKTGGFSAHGGVSTKLRLLGIEQVHRHSDDALF